MHSLINNNPMVDCIEEEYENCLLKSVINELNTSFDATKASSLDLSPLPNLTMTLMFLGRTLQRRLCIFKRKCLLLLQQKTPTPY